MKLNEDRDLGHIVGDLLFQRLHRQRFSPQMVNMVVPWFLADDGETIVQSVLVKAAADIVATDTFNACDSAGFFWVWKHYVGHSNIHRVADDGISTESVGRMSILINGGGNGYNDCQQYAAFIFRYRSDTTATDSTGTVTVTRQRIVTHPHQTPTWGQATASTQVQVDYTPQRS
ncbi:hypothetical protein [Paraburkholderia fungorum]|uniref:Uncharacterized protein n=1 Tax=Paraburkholderia fungorum TaxID=134537 RepID=A0AAP5Q5Y8_9BURK|nr:hypothetical protein [Paraburkholderia fungorum]MDT8837655.1 hypothetical protein [Paraburkholderia fungorum]USU16247.1 hypothetical protein NFE55_00150 [Paraburkholderia fungorum]USU24191.1 hypothetical protein NFS19_00150 [Paraburkholderia fungorum]